MMAAALFLPLWATASISPREHYQSLLAKSTSILPPASLWRTPGHWNGNGAKPASFSAGFSDYGVLQRDTKTSIYGMPGSPFTLPATVKLTFDGHEYTAEVTNTSGIGEWSVLLDSHPAGGDFNISVACTSGCEDNSTTTISHVTFGDIWYCAGQSNMQLELLHTFSRNKTFDMLSAGKYDNLRLYQHPQIASPTPLWVQPAPPVNPKKPSLHFRWQKATDAVTNEIEIGDYMHPKANMSILNTYGGVCMYFGLSLTDLMHKNGEADVPLGLMDVAWGGTMIEQWTTNATTSTCRNCTVHSTSGTLFNGMVGPFANMSLKGWLWYQGENNIGRGTHNPYGPSKLGYACQLPAMIALWRRTWSRTPHTTDPLAPFGVVDIHAGGSEGQGGDGAMGNFRWAQTASYGVLPNEAMPNTFMANAYDLGDPWAKNCFYLGCCTEWTDQPDLHNITKSPTCVQKNPNYNGWSWDRTTFFMGPIHARPKLLVGQRLAQGAFNSVYGGHGPMSGPVISKCSRHGDSLLLEFNSELLAGDTVQVQQYNSTLKASAMQAYWNHTLEANGQYTPSQKDCLVADGVNKKNNQTIYKKETCWQYVDISQAGPYTVKIDISHPLPSTTVGGLRYAWEDRYGCGDMDMAVQPCAMQSHPIVGAKSRLPAMPFILSVGADSCACVAPQKC